MSPHVFESCAVSDVPAIGTQYAYQNECIDEAAHAYAIALGQKKSPLPDSRSAGDNNNSVVNLARRGKRDKQ